MIRIVAGKYRGAVLEAPDSARPTLSRSRQVIFDILNSMDCVENFNEKIVLDCFAGSGALGIEALSRGAKFAYFFDKAPEAIVTIKKNLEKLRTKNNAAALRIDLAAAPSPFLKRSTKCDIIFVDPPYGKISIVSTLQRLQKFRWLHEKTLLVIEEDKRSTEDLSVFETIRTKICGNSSFRFARMR